jgi:glutamate carboxypeptidase
MNHDTILAYFEEKQPAILETIQMLVELETPSADKARLDAFAQLLADRYAAVGARTEIIPSAERGNHVRAIFDDPAYVADPQAAPALILCHFDTVWNVGSLATHPFRVDEQGWAYGPGIFDMQSSLALVEYMLAGVQDLKLSLPRPVVLLATADEEIGSHSSRDLIEEEARRAAYVLVMESPLPGGVLKTARKGSGNFTVTVTGRAAHAGVEPERGISAIQEMAHQVLRLHGLNNPEKGTTVNVGTVTGGTHVNVVAPHATAKVDVRAWSQAEMDRIDHCIRNLRPALEGAEIHVEGGENRPALETKVTRDLFRQAQTIGQGFGLALQEGSTGGGSDGNLTGALGVPTLDGLGVPGHGAHADHEHIEVDQIAGRAALLTGLVMELVPPEDA